MYIKSGFCSLELTFSSWTADHWLKFLVHYVKILVWVRQRILPILCPSLIFWTMLLTLLNLPRFLTHLPPPLTFSWENPPHLWIPHFDIWITIWIYFHVYYYCRDIRWGKMDTLEKRIQHNEGHFQLWLPIILLFGWHYRQMPCNRFFFLISS